MRKNNALQKTLIFIAFYDILYKGEIPHEHEYE